MPTPSPFPVELWPHDPAWAEAAERESVRLAAALGSSLLTVHHVGSTAIPGIRAKPILDLMPVLVSPSALDEAKAPIESLGFAWWGELGLPGRRYCTFNDPATGRRRVQLHCYAAGNEEITRHLAFRDYLRARPDLARAYEAEKVRCRDLHPQDTHAYCDCKSEWIQRVEQEALRWLDRGET